MIQKQKKLMYSRKEILHVAIREIRDLTNNYKYKNGFYPLTRLDEINDMLFRLDILNADKSALLYKICLNMI